MSFTVNPITGCWIADRVHQPTGYGRVSVGGRRVLAHRHEWERVHGPVPAGLELDHLCQNRACCNPAHLEAVTHAENVRRGTAARATRQRAQAKTHCVHGHEYTPENTRRTAKQRICRTCELDQQRARRARAMRDDSPVGAELDLAALA